MIKTRTIIPFGIPGDPSTLVHFVKDNSLIIKETFDSGAEVGDYIYPGEMDPENYTGREFELEFNHSESLAPVIERLISIHQQLRREEFIRDHGACHIMVWTHKG